MEPKRIFTIGRSTDCDIVLADPSVSRHHAELSRIENNKWLLTDFHSKYGTFVMDGNRPVVVREKYISSTDILRFADFTVTARTLLEKIEEEARIHETIPRWERSLDVLAHPAWAVGGVLIAVLSILSMVVWD